MSFTLNSTSISTSLRTSLSSSGFISVLSSSSSLISSSKASSETLSKSSTQNSDTATSSTAPTTSDVTSSLSDSTALSSISLSSSIAFSPSSTSEISSSDTINPSPSPSPTITTASTVTLGSPIPSSSSSDDSTTPSPTLVESTFTSLSTMSRSGFVTTISDIRIVTITASPTTSKGSSAQLNTPTSTAAGQAGSASSTPTSTIVGSVVGSVAGVALIGLVILMLLTHGKKKRRRLDPEVESKDGPVPGGPPPSSLSRPFPFNLFSGLMWPIGGTGSRSNRSNSLPLPSSLEQPLTPQLPLDYSSYYRPPRNRDRISRDDSNGTSYGSQHLSPDGFSPSDDYHQSSALPLRYDGSVGIATSSDVVDGEFTSSGDSFPDTQGTSSHSLPLNSMVHQYERTHGVDVYPSSADITYPLGYYESVPEERDEPDDSYSSANFYPPRSKHRPLKHVYHNYDTLPTRVFAGRSDVSNQDTTGFTSTSEASPEANSDPSIYITNSSSNYAMPRNQSLFTETGSL